MRIHKLFVYGKVMFCYICINDVCSRWVGGSVKVALGTGKLLYAGTMLSIKRVKIGQL